MIFKLPLMTLVAETSVPLVFTRPMGQKGREHIHLLTLKCIFCILLFMKHKNCNEQLCVPLKVRRPHPAENHRK